MTKKPEILNEEYLVQRKNGLRYKKYAKGPFTGIVLSFHQNGLLKSRVKYIYGRPPGPNVEFLEEECPNLYEEFNEKGQLIQAGNYNQEGNSLSILFNEEGEIDLRVTYFKKNKPNTRLIESFNKGYLESRVTYYPDARRLRIKHGLEETYYENGQLRLKSHWKNGKLHGLNEYFDEQGNLTKSETWENEKLIK